MCNQITRLAGVNDYYNVARCEHGTMFITWGHVTISLKPGIFQQLCTALDTTHLALVHEGHRRSYTDITVALVDNQQNIQFWVAGVGLYFDTKEFGAFRELIQAGANALDLDLAAFEDEDAALFAGHCSTRLVA